MTPRNAHWGQNLTPHDCDKSDTADEIPLVLQKLSEATFTQKRRGSERKGKIVRGQSGMTPGCRSWTLWLVLRSKLKGADLGVQKTLPCPVFHDVKLTSWKYFKTVKYKLQTIFLQAFPALSTDLKSWLIDIQNFTFYTKVNKTYTKVFHLPRKQTFKVVHDRNSRYLYLKR